MMHSDRVAILSNTEEPRWLNATIIGKELFICPDFSSIGCTWSKAFFLSAVGDRYLSAEQKFKNKRVVDSTKRRGLICSNTGMPWKETSKEVSRRLVPFHFKNTPTTMDSSLERDLPKEIPALFAKGVYAYGLLRGEIEDADLFDCIRTVPVFAAAYTAMKEM